MQTLFAELYVAVVAATGFGIGLYLHARLHKTHETDVRLPSPFKEPTVWLGDAHPTHA